MHPGPVCGGLFKTKSALTNHRKWKHEREGLVERENDEVVCVCPDCGDAFVGSGGLNVHRRSAHPDVYHAARQPAARVKARWNHEELVLVARAGLELRRTKPREGIVRALHSRFPARSFESIKCLRNKNPRYAEVLAALEAEEAVRVSSASEVAANASIPQSSVPHAACNDYAWADQLRMAINTEHLGVVHLDWVVNGCPDQGTQDMLDELFASWVGKLVRGERAAVRCP